MPIPCQIIINFCKIRIDFLLGLCYNRFNKTGGADMTRIYLITNLLNGKQYVGKTRYSLAHRFTQHCNNDWYHTYIHNAIKKYGKENFTIQEICTCPDDRWRELEQFYIKHYHTHHTEGGYNITWGGDDNPMDDESIRVKHKSIMGTTDMIAKTRKPFDEWNYGNTEARREFNKKTSQRQKGVYLPQFQNHNNSTKHPIAMLDDDGNIVMRFESTSDACRYVNKTEGKKINKSYSAIFKRYADKFNKNGKRAKFLGHAWKML